MQLCMSLDLDGHQWEGFYLDPAQAPHLRLSLCHRSMHCRVCLHFGRDWPSAGDTKTPSKLILLSSSI